MLFQLTQQVAKEKHWKLNWRQIGPTFPKNVVRMIRDSQTIVLQKPLNKNPSAHSEALTFDI